MPGRRKDIDELCQRRRDRADFEVLVVQVVDRFTRAGLRHGFALEERLIALGVKVLFVGEDMVLDGEHGDLLRAFKYSAAQSFAKDLSHRISSAHMRSLKEGRKTTTAVFPYGVDKLVSSPAGVPLYRIRDNRDGTQSKLHAETLRLIDTYGSVGGRTGRFRKEKDDRVTFVPGSEVEQAIVRDVYIWHYRDGLGACRVAKRLNDQKRFRVGGKRWNEGRITQMLNAAVYTGFTVGLAAHRGIYSGLSNGEPKKLNRPESELLTKESMPIIYRTPEEAFRQNHPAMGDFLPSDIRDQAIEDQERRRRQRYATSLLPEGQKRHGRGNSKRGSAYLLSGLLRSTDGKVLVGVRCGPPDRPKRYYRVKGSRFDLDSSKVSRRMVAAEPLEKAVLEQLQKRLARGDLEQLLVGCVQAELELTEAGSKQLAELHRLREQANAKIVNLLRNFDESLPQTKQVVAELKDEVAEHSRQIERLERQIAAGPINVETLVREMMEQIENLATDSSTMPVERLKDVVHAFVDEAVVDLANRDVRIVVRLPDWSGAAEPTLGSTRPLRLVGLSGSRTSNRTHPSSQAKNVARRPILLKMACRAGRKLRPPSYRCRCARRLSGGDKRRTKPERRPLAA